MPFDDAAEADDQGFRPPPHPEDRLWRHPSELRAHPVAPLDGGARRPAPPSVAATPGGGRGRRWLPVAAAGVAGAGLAWAALGVSGGRDRVVERVAVGPAADVVDVPGAAVADRTGVAAVAVSAAGALGSGVVVRDDGIVVTSAGLVPTGSVPTVVLADGTRPGVEVVGVDEATGLAVLDLEGEGYAPSVLADARAEAPAAASVVGATGAGSGAARADEGGLVLRHADGEVGVPRRAVGPTGAELHGVQVTGDADGRELGGPVLDGRGAVVGVVTAVDEGVAWCVAPVAVVRRISDELLADGVVDHPWLGIEGADAPGDGAGVLVASVVDGGPAADGGLRAGDRVVALDDDGVADMAALLVALRARAPGDRVDVTTARDDGARDTLVLRLASAPTG